MAVSTTSSLSVFPPPPPDGEVTLCEYNANFISENYKTADLSKYVPATQGLDYPVIDLNTDTRREGVKSVKSLTSDWDAWCSENIVAETGRQDLRKDGDASWSTFASEMYKMILKWISAAHEKVYPHLNISKGEMLSVFASVANWSSSPVRALAWHPHVAKFAVALQDDTVKIHTMKSHVVPVLRHKQQKGVTCLSWRPLSAAILAVGCETGVLIWFVDPTSPVTRLGSSCTRHLSFPGHCPVTTISWSPGGQLLATGSPMDSSLLIWNVAMETVTPLYRASGGVTLIKWSPDEKKLFAAGPSSIFRVWETQTWTSEKWSHLAGRCQEASWSPDGSILLFAVAHEPSLYLLHFHEPTDLINQKRVMDSAQLAVKCADFTPHSWDVCDKRISIGGSVCCMDWDPYGERLAVIFADEDGEVQELVTVFKTRLKPVFEVLPSGFVRGPEGSIPHSVAFQKNFDKGALLSVGWSDETISFIPLLFTPSVVLEANKLPPNNGTCLMDHQGCVLQSDHAMLAT